MNSVIRKNGTADEAALERINRYTRRPYTAEEVYTFSVVLCDNEVDRDYECFTTAALHRLAELFVGKTGLLDHEHSSRNQSARIYGTSVKTFPEKRTSCGEVYAQLTAEAYMVRSAETESFIASVDGGIRKEVSVGCAVKKRTCSICGGESCGHIRGRMYDGVQCVRILDEPTDAYEFSFVAVPAQRAAGVVKKFSRADKKEVRSMSDILKRLEDGEGSVTVSGEELAVLHTELKALRDRAACGDRYRESLCRDILKHSAVAQPQFGRGLMEAIVKNLCVEELEDMAQALLKMAEARMPVMPQLAGRAAAEKAADDGAFRI